MQEAKKQATTLRSKAAKLQRMAGRHSDRANDMREKLMRLERVEYSDRRAAAHEHEKAALLATRSVHKAMRARRESEAEKDAESRENELEAKVTRAQAEVNRQREALERAREKKETVADKLEEAKDGKHFSDKFCICSVDVCLKLALF